MTRSQASAVVRRAPDAVWAWWTDHGAPGSRTRIFHGLGWSTRTVVANEGGVVTLRESVLGIPLVTHTVEVTGPMRFRERARSYDSYWSFEPHPDGTLVRREMETRRWAPRGLSAWLMGVDLRAHARACERDLGHER